jgi:hypothetical protein
MVPRWQPHLELPRGKSIQKAVFSKLVYCDDHKRETVIGKLLSDEGYHKLRKHVREHGHTMPAMNRLKLGWTILEIQIESQSSPEADDSLPF